MPPPDRVLSAERGGHPIAAGRFPPNRAWAMPLGLPSLRCPDAPRAPARRADERRNRPAWAPRTRVPPGSRFHRLTLRVGGRDVAVWWRTSASL